MESVDVLVIGAGINGAATFRDLAFQGLDVVLVDKGDICSGTSAAPSRMIHGGLRYLEHGEFRLVKEALRERDLLLHNARHFVRPLPTFIPVKSWTSGIGTVIGTFLRLDLDSPAERGGLMVRSGLTLYDLYTRKRRTMPSHEFLEADEALERWPALDPDIVGVARYHDAWISHPERLCLEVVLDGVAAGGTATSYTEVAGMSDGRVVLRDVDSGEERTIAPRLVINAAGPWIDKVNESLGIHGRLIGGTKGSHLVLDHPGLADLLDGEMLYHETRDGRTGLIFPWNGKVIAGTTDIRVDDPDEVETDEAEIDYILETVADAVPGLEVTRDHIDATYVGVRPLPFAGDLPTVKISRDHSMPVSEPDDGRPFPVFSLVGGKWTTFRAFAEEATDAALEVLDRERRVVTEPAEIGGARGYPADPGPWLDELAEVSGLAPERVADLVGRYGTTVERMLDDLSGEVALSTLPTYSDAELAWVAAHEQVRHLVDILDRRTTIAVLGEASDDVIEEVARVVAPALGWDEARRTAEVERAIASVRRRHGVPGAAA
jgi:glycerol-3-phosphate dehydrogenase